MEVSFCNNCDNLLYIYKNDEGHILNVCKVCNSQNPIKEQMICAYSSKVELNKTHILSTNKYVTHDITLPIIKDNKNITCNNPECTDPTTMNYIKYNDADMKYIYICRGCGNTWNNNL